MNIPKKYPNGHETNNATNAYQSTILSETAYIDLK
jgi:hypothetical protein